MGMTPNSSKKGPFGIGAHSKMQVNANEAETTLAGAPNEVLSRRVEYVEGQERRLSAKMMDEQRRTNEQFDAMREKLDAKFASSTASLFNESQWVYGRVATSLTGIEAGGKPQEALEAYRAHQRAEVGAHDAPQIVQLAEKGDAVLLLYPMERVECGASENYQFMMRMKHADPSTGQLSIKWAIVFAKIGRKEVFSISRFSLTPN